MDTPTLKAAFLYRFAQFTDWPVDALGPGADLVLCVVGDPAVAQSLDQAANGRDIDGHTVAVLRLKPTEQIRSCHMLYVSGMNKKQALELLDSLKGVAVFTVSDLVTFTGIGGTAHFFVENDHMRFAVNVQSAQRGRLSLRSQLLSLAKRVKDDPNESSR